MTEEVTGANGVATQYSGRVKGHGTIKFTITEIVKTGLTYVLPPGGDSASIAR